ncbi:MAG TPA: Lon-like protease helical domain-containing protein, partial [Dehalococcoidia bacterium]
MARTAHASHVPVQKLRRICDPKLFKFRTTDEVEPLEGTVGQDRAVRALDFGLNIDADNFNVYVSGQPGTGRSTELRTQLDFIAAKRPAARDWCYVFNFREPTRPQALSLPPDCGHQLAHAIDQLIESVRNEVPKAFESDEYAQRRDQVNRDMQAQREQLFEALKKEAEGRGLSVNVNPMGITTVPVIDGAPLTQERYHELSDEQRHEIQEKTSDMDSVIAQMVPQLRRLDRDGAGLRAELDKQVMVGITAPMLQEIKDDFK